MRECRTCGTKQSANLQYCVNCGAEMNASHADPNAALSESDEETAQDEEISILGEKFYVGTLRPSRTEKKVGYASIGGGFLSALLSIIVDPYYALCILFFLLTAFYALFPGLLWKLELFEMNMKLDSPTDSEPSDGWLRGRKVGVWICLISSISLFLFELYFLTVFGSYI